MSKLLSVILCLVAVEAVAASRVRTYDVHRFLMGGLHLFTLDYNEGLTHGAAYEGVGFRVAVRPRPGRVPLYRCAVTGVGYPFLSLLGNCEGQSYVGTLGYVFQGQEPGTLQLYRCVSPVNGDHLATVNPQECAIAGYQVEGPLGFVFP